MFEELYDTKTLSKFQTEFSFINRTFIFKKSNKKEELVELSKEEEIPKEQIEKPKSIVIDMIDQIRGTEIETQKETASSTTSKPLDHQDD